MGKRLDDWKGLMRLRIAAGLAGCVAALALLVGAMAIDAGADSRWTAALGDMLRAVYDTNADGVVDTSANAVNLGGVTPTAAGLALLDDADAAAQRTTLSLVPGTHVQAYDADLVTYAGITPSANVQTLLGEADYSAMRTSLSLVPGTHVQAWDQDLTDLSAAGRGTATQVYTSNGAGSAPTWQDAAGGVSDGDKGDLTVSAGGTTWTVDGGVVTAAKMAASATDVVFGRSTAGAGAGEEIPCTAAARSIMDDTTVAAIRTTLGIPGTGVGSAYVRYSSYSTHSANIPDDNTTPQRGETSDITSVAYTPTSISTKLRILATGHVVNVSGGGITPLLCLFRDGTADAVATNYGPTLPNNYAGPFVVTIDGITPSAAATPETWVLSIGGLGSAGNLRLGGGSAARFNGTLSVLLSVEEYIP